MTALSGLPAYLDRGSPPTRGSKRRHPGVDGRADGDVACDGPVRLNLSGGESVDDLRLLERDEGKGACLLGSPPDRVDRIRVAQGASPRGAVAYGGEVSSPRRGRGGQEAACRSYGQRRAAWAELGPGSREAIRDTPGRLWTVSSTGQAWTLRW